MPVPRSLTTALLPVGHGLRRADVTISPEAIVADLRSTAPRAACPVCGTLSGSIHSRYRRTVADLPWGRCVVRLHLHVRKFLCRALTCRRRIFTERLPAVVAPYARRTACLESILRILAFALGGEPGTRLVGRLGMAASPATLLRLIRRAVVAERPMPRVLGVDDWAFRKGHRFGTILVDLERHRIVEVLPARNADPLVEWLQAHPGVEAFSRDRAPVYAEAAKKGAPHAVQVADRWHLIQNLVEALGAWVTGRPAYNRLCSQARLYHNRLWAEAPVTQPPRAVPAALQTNSQGGGRAGRLDPRATVRLDRG